MPSDPTAEGTGHVIVCGLGDVALRVVEQLRLAGEDVVVLADTPEPARVRIAEEFGARHVEGNGRREADLGAAGIDDAAALVSAADSDLADLEIALLARRLRPGMRVVVELNNPAVARAMARTIGAGAVLDVAAIAAPALAEACLDQRSRPLDIGGERFVLQEITVEADGALRSLVGDLAPVAVVPANAGPLVVCPGRDEQVSAGDRVVVIGDPTGVAALTAPPDPGDGLRTGTRQPTHRGRPRGAPPPAPWLGQARRYVRGAVSESPRALRITLGVLFVVALVSVVLLQIGYRRTGGGRMSVLDSVYFTTETLTTVGFGDFFFGNQSDWLRVWAILLMIIGAALVTILYALLTNLLVSRRIAQSLGRQLATRMHDHVILVGLGSVGLQVLEALIRARAPVVVLERDEDNRFLPRARELGVPVVLGDSTIAASLDAANLARARAVAVLTSSDLVNIETGLAVTELLGERRDHVPVVLRVFDRTLAATLGSAFGFDGVRSTSELAAPWFVGAALGLDILSTFYVERQPMLIGRLTVAEAGGLQGQTMAQLSARLRVIAIRRRGGHALEFPPRRDTRFAGGDQAYLVGPYEELLRVLRRDAQHAGG